MVYVRPSKAFNCTRAIYGESNSLAQKGEADLCSSSMYLKAISCPQSWGELLNATKLRLGALLGQREMSFQDMKLQTKQKLGVIFPSLFLSLKPDPSKWQKPTHTLKDWELLCAERHKLQIIIPSFFLWGKHAVLFRQRSRDRLCVHARLKSFKVC